MKTTIEKAYTQAPRAIVAESQDFKSEPVDMAIPVPLLYSRTRVVRVDEALLRKQRILTPGQTDAAAHAYKVLRTQVLQRMRANQWNTLAVTSPRPEEGKTLTAINLAISLAREVNLTVLLVDMDLRRPTVHRHFGFQPEVGLSDYLLHGQPIPEMLFNPGVERLVVLPGREPLINSSEMMGSPAMLALMDELKKRYARRIVVFDLPPLLYSDDVLAFAPLVDATLLVVAEDKTPRDDLKQAKQLLQGTTLLGTMVNRARTSVPGYY